MTSDSTFDVRRSMELVRQPTTRDAERSMSNVERPMSNVRASAPGGIGNIGPGLDVLGCAVDGPRDEVTVEWCDADGVVVRASGHAEIPREAARHSSALAAASVLRRARAAGVRMPAPGLAVSLVKRLPLAGGQGGSAASAVAGAVAVNALLGHPLDARTLLECCLDAESAVAGRHLDNVAPILAGGIALVRDAAALDVVRLPTPRALHFVLVQPDMRLQTADARRVLPATVPREVVVRQMAATAAMVAACHDDDVAAFGRAVDDRIAEPARAAMLPGFAEAKRAALGAGAYGASISGAGPTLFAVVGDVATGERVAAAARDAYESAGLRSSSRIARVDERGAVVHAAGDAE